MPSFETTRWWGNTTDANDRRLIVLPGLHYPLSIAGLFVPVVALAESGWTVWSVEWDLTEVADNPQATAMVIAQALGEALTASAGARDTLVIGKSIGTIAATCPAMNGIPAVWLTPLLRRSEVVAGIRANPARQLLVGGTADPAWDPEAARESGAEVLCLPGVNHGMYADAGWRGYLDVLRTVGDAVLGFAAG